jgi:hypothetical protein
MLRIPESDDSSLPPELGNEVEWPNDIYTQVKVINIDSINTVLIVVVGLTIELTLKWRDHNIDYENLKNVIDQKGLSRIIPHKEKSNIWLPLPELVHDNAIIGETKRVNVYKLGVEVKNNSMPMDPSLSRETLIYPGKDHILVIKQRMKLQYRCEFLLVYFPFDD